MAIMCLLRLPQEREEREREKKKICTQAMGRPSFAHKTQRKKKRNRDDGRELIGK